MAALEPLGAPPGSTVHTESAEHWTTWNNLTNVSIHPRPPHFLSLYTMVWVLGYPLPLVFATKYAAMRGFQAPTDSLAQDSHYITYTAQDLKRRSGLSHCGTRVPLLACWAANGLMMVFALYIDPESETKFEADRRIDYNLLPPTECVDKLRTLMGAKKLYAGWYRQDDGSWSPDPKDLLPPPKLIIRGDRSSKIEHAAASQEARFAGEAVESTHARTREEAVELRGGDVVGGEDDTKRSGIAAENGLEASTPTQLSAMLQECNLE